MSGARRSRTNGKGGGDAPGKKFKDESVRGERRIVLMTPEAGLSANSTGAEREAAFVQLRHPMTGRGALYMFTDDCKRVHEVMTFDEGHRSWFIDNTVQQDGSLKLTTPVDPLFLILPYLSQANRPAASLYRQLECILEDAEFPETRRLTFCPLRDISLIAQVKGEDDCLVYRYDEGRTLDWLKLKVDRLSEALRGSGLNVSKSARVATFVRSTKNPNASEVEFSRYAFALISQYVQPELASRLQQHLGIPSTEVDSSVEPASKKCRLDSTVLAPTDDYSLGFKPAVKKVDKRTTAQKSLDKVDTHGMKSLSSFFGAKPAGVTGKK